MNNILFDKLNTLLRYMDNKKKQSTDLQLRKNKYAQIKIKNIIKKKK